MEEAKDLTESGDLRDSMDISLVLRETLVVLTPKEKEESVEFANADCGFSKKMHVVCIYLLLSLLVLVVEKVAVAMVECRILFSKFPNSEILSLRECSQHYIP